MYVDNIVVTALESMYIVYFKIVLGNNFNITSIGELKFMLGIFVIYDYTNQLIFLSQSTYIHQVLTCFGIQDAILFSTLLAIKHNLSIFQSSILETEKYAYKKYIDNIHHLSLVEFFLQHKLGPTFSLWLISLFNLEAIQILLLQTLFSLYLHN